MYRHRRSTASPPGIILLLLLQLTLHSFAVFAQTVPESGLIDVNVPLLLDGEHFADIPVRVSIDDPSYLRIHAGELEKALERILLPEIRALLERRGGKDGFLIQEDLADAGILPAFRFDTLELQISIPAELRNVETLRLSNPSEKGTSYQAVPGAAVSGYLNVSPSLTLSSGNPLVNPISDTEFGLDLNGALNIKSWVSEAAVRLAASDTFSFKLDAVRLKHDFREREFTLTLGDLSYRTEGFQTGGALKGASVASFPSSAGNAVSVPSGDDVLIIQERSTIEVILNGRPVKTLSVQPGRFRLRDFNVMNGTNTVTLKITDDSGNTAEYSYFIPFNSSMLRRGDSSYSYSLGLPSWEPAVPKLLLYHTFGVSDELNLGVNFQTDLTYRNLGGRLAYAATFGIFNLDASISHENVDGFDWAARLSHAFLKKDGLLPFNTSASVFWTGPVFYAETPATNLGFNAYLGTTFPFGMNAGFGFSVRAKSDFSMREHEFLLSMNQRFSDSLSLSADLAFRPERMGRDAVTGRITLMSHQPGNGQSLYVTHNLERHQADASWSRQVRKPGETSSVQIGLQGLPPTSDAQKGISLNASYTGYQFSAGMSSHLITIENSVTLRNYLQAGTSVVYADGIFSLASPQSGSFAIAVPPPGAKNARLGINPVSGGYAAAGPLWLPPVLSLNNGYDVENVLVEIETDSELIDRAGEWFAVLPGYRSGTVLRLTNDVGVSVRGTFLYADGSPVSLTAGEFAPLDEGGTASDLLFTDEEGRFELYNLKPGRYSLFLSGYEEAVGTMDVQAADDGYFEAGAFEVEKPRDYGEIR